MIVGAVWADLKSFNGSFSLAGCSHEKYQEHTPNAVEDEPLLDIRAKGLIMVYFWLFFLRTPKTAQGHKLCELEIDTFDVQSGINFSHCTLLAAERTLLPVAQLLAAATLIFCSLLTAVEHV